MTSPCHTVTAPLSVGGSRHSRIKKEAYSVGGFTDRSGSAKQNCCPILDSSLTYGWLQNGYTSPLALFAPLSSPILRLRSGASGEGVGEQGEEQFTRDGLMAFLPQLFGEGERALRGVTRLHEIPFQNIRLCQAGVQPTLFGA